MIEIETGADSRQTYVRPVFLNFDLGFHRVRLLGKFHKIWTHYIPAKKSTIDCLGTDCPICQNNKSLKLTNPDNYKSMPGYISASLRHYINVLDRTMVRVCPNCHTENKADLSLTFPGMCKSCGALISTIVPVPSNKVKIINISDTLAGELAVKQASTLDLQGELIGLENMDVIFTVTKAGGKKNVSADVDSNATDKVEVTEEAFYDLSSVTIRLQPDETKNLLAGVSLKDIFAARRGVTAVPELVNEEIMEETQQKLDKLFKN